MTTLMILGQTNTPWHPDKVSLGLLPSDQRPAAFYESIEKVAAGRPFVATANEMHLGIVNGAPEGWDAALPFPNNRRPRVLGNGFVWNDQVGMKAPMHQLEQTINTGGTDRQIHLPLARVRPLGQRLVVPIRNVHAPRKKDDPAGNRRVHEAAIQNAVGIAKRNGRCVVMGDPNDKVKARYEAAGAHCYQFSIGFIAAFGDVHLENCRAIQKGAKGVWSDHYFLVAALVRN